MSSSAKDSKITSQARQTASRTQLRGFLCILALTFLIGLALFQPAAQALELPPRPSGPVADMAGVIPADDAAKMDALSREVWEKTRAAVVIATVKDLQGESIEEYGNKLYESWGLGEKGKDRGVLILASVAERKLRIEVGYGLEGIIPDGLAGQIIRDDIVPSFKRGDFGGGLLRGEWSCAQIIAKDAGVTLSGEPPARVNTSGRSGRQFFFVIIAIAANLFYFLMIRRRPKGSFRRGPLGGTYIGPFGGGGFGGGGFGGFGGGFGGFGGGSSGGGGASGGW